jgi:uncharacterized protein (TIGR00290 family)
MTEPVIVGWSGGKDCTLALREIVRGARYTVASLLTTVTREYERVSMHGVRRSLLRAQAASLGLPLYEVELSPQCSNTEYEAAMDAALTELRAATPGIERVAFGDLFLEDIRAYRERQLARAGLRGLFPLWGRDTREVAAEFSALGYRAVVVCIDSTVLPRELAGREYDDAFVRALPAGADPCGENGEFHTFVYDGPPFAFPIAHARGEVVVRDERFVYADLIDTAGPAHPTAAGAEPAARAHG